MPYFGARSLKNLEYVHPKLKDLFQEVVKKYDCAVICGFRGMEEQEAAFHAGKSQHQWPNSKHNQNPSRAVDAIPWPVDWSDKNRFYHFAGYVRGVAERLGIGIRWGGDWDSDFNLKDQNFYDLPHFELTDAQ